MTGTTSSTRFILKSLNDKPKTIEEILTETGLHDRNCVMTNLRYFMKIGIAVRTGERPNYFYQKAISINRN